jgi:hypothetical protein
VVLIETHPDEALIRLNQLLFGEEVAIAVGYVSGDRSAAEIDIILRAVIE